MRPATDGLAALSETQRQELEALLLDFDQTWQPDALARRVRSLPSDNVSFLQAAILELTKVDLERQWNAGNHRKVEEYLQRYPALGTQETVDVGLLLAEYGARRRALAPAALRDFQLRFPQRFEQLRRLLEQAGASRSAPAASIDTSQSGKVSETMVEGVSRLAKLPKEFGRYRILKRLGEGGMGSVYLAHDTDLDRKVALKVPKFEGGKNKQLITRFYREARAAANLRHANICPVYDVGETDGTHYISMAYIEGRPLSAYIRSNQGPSQRQVALVIRKLALALQDAHSLGIVHRDLKPANVMIDEKKEPVVMDFGLARQLDQREDSRLTQQGTVMGSPAYMSPEQVAGDVDQIGPATDIYSLGVILFELLTGRVPFEGPMTAVLGQIMTQEPPGPSEFREDLDPRLAGICQRMMTRRIEDRYGSMQEAADALTDYLKAPAGEKSAAAEPLSTPGGEQRGPQKSSPIFATPPPQPLRVTVPEQPKRLLGVKRLSLPVRVTPRMWVIGVGAAALIGLLLLGVMLTLRTPHGTVTIEIDDPNLQLSIDGTEYTISQLEQPRELDAGDHQFAIKLGEQTIPVGETIRLRTAEYEGEYRLSVALDDATLTSDRFAVTRHGQQVLRIELHAIPTETTRPERTSGVEMPETGLAETSGPSDTGERATDGSIRASQLPFQVTASARPRAPRRVLIFSQSEGYYHECIPLAQRTFRLMGEETGAYSADLNDEDSFWLELDRYDALILNNTAYYRFSKPQQTALLEFVQDGKGLVLAHGAIGSFGDWPAGLAMVGASFDSHPWNQDGTWTVAVEEPDHPLNRAFGGRGFRVQDELFKFGDPYSRERLRVLLGLDMSDPRNQVGGRPDGDNALSWIREFGKGRVFFCNFGHHDHVYTNAAIMQHYLDGIQYALGDLEADATPSAGGATSALGATTSTQDSWKTLFNGVNLNGWTPVGTGNWSVEGGILKADGSGTGWLMSDGEYADFELEIGYRLPAAGNSGVLLRAWPEGSPNGADFLEIQLIDDHHPKYSKLEPKFAKTGAIFGVVGPVSNPHGNPGLWHRMRIRAMGNQLQVIQDDSQILDAELGDYPERLERVPGLTRTQGRIGMQMPLYGTSVEFRSVRLRELGTSAKSESAADPKIQVLAITGGHPFEEKPFFDVFEAIPDVEVTKATLPAVAARLKPSLADEYDVLVLYDLPKEGLSVLERRNVIALLRRGIGVVALHHSLGAHQDWPEYLKIIGGKYQLQPGLVDGKRMPASTVKANVDLHVQVAAPQHAITLGVSAFDIRDEAYAGVILDPSVTVLLTTQNSFNDPEVAWVKNYGNSRVFYLQFGHDRHAYENPNFRLLVLRGVQWAAGRLAPNDKASGDHSRVVSVPQPPTTSTPSEDWISLFDGKTLSGWKRLMGNAPFSVEDGTIVGRIQPGVTKSFLCTEANFMDFLLELEFLVDPGMNSGVQIRSNSLSSYKNGVVHGYQVEINSQNRPDSATGGIFDEGRQNVFLDSLEQNAAAKRAFRPRSWNTLRVRAVGDSIQTWLNDVPAANVRDLMLKSGFIGLQVHPGNRSRETREVRFRNIRLKQLNGTPPDVSDARPTPSNRVRWEKESGLAFVRLADGSWQEQGDDGKTYSFSEERRSAGFVELTGRTEPGVTYRLLSETALISRRGARYTEKYQGRWSDWTSLFNGRSLEGWEIDGSQDAWRVEQGVIVGSGGTSFLVSIQEFREFELQTDCLLSADANSGVYFRSDWTRESPDRRSRVRRGQGYQVQICGPLSIATDYPGKEGFTGTIFAEWAGPNPRSVRLALTDRNLVPTDEWFRLSIRVQADHVTIRVNDRIACDRAPLGEIFDNRKLALEILGAEGYVSFKNLIIRDLQE